MFPNYFYFRPILHHFFGTISRQFWRYPRAVFGQNFGSFLVFCWPIFPLFSQPVFNSFLPIDRPISRSFLADIKPNLSSGSDHFPDFFGSLLSAKENQQPNLVAHWSFSSIFFTNFGWFHNTISNQFSGTYSKQYETILGSILLFLIFWQIPNEIFKSYSTHFRTNFWLINNKTDQAGQLMKLADSLVAIERSIDKLDKWMGSERRNKRMAAAPLKKGSMTSRLPRCDVTVTVTRS